MIQKRTTSLIIIFIIVIALVLGGIWYWQGQKEKELPTTMDTSTWLPYVVGNIQFSYPADWKIEKREITLAGYEKKNYLGFVIPSALAEEQKTAIEITLTPILKQSEKDIIKIGGKIKSCDRLEPSYKCKEALGIPIYTLSVDDLVVQTLNKLTETFKIYFEVVDGDTGIAINNIQIVLNGRTMTKEEFKEYLQKEAPFEERIYFDILPEGDVYVPMKKVWIFKSRGELRETRNLYVMPTLAWQRGEPRTDIPELREEYIRSLLKPGTVLVIGFVVDDILYKPIEEVKVNIPKLNLNATTNARGFYFLNVPEYPGKIDSCEKLIETAITYVYSKDGFKTFERGQDYPVNVKGPDVREPYYVRLNAIMFYGTGKIIHEYMPPGACGVRR